MSLQDIVRTHRKIGVPLSRTIRADTGPLPGKVHPNLDDLEKEEQEQEIIKPARKSQTMPQVSIALEASVIQEVDMRAAQLGLSRSKWISNLVVHSLFNVEQESFELEKMNLEVQHLQGLLAERDLRLQELHAYRVYMEGQLARVMAERDRMLPESRPGFWSRLFRRG